MLPHPDVLVVDNCGGTDAGQFLEYGGRGGPFGVDNKDACVCIECHYATQVVISTYGNEASQAGNAGFATNNGNVTIRRNGDRAHGGDGSFIGNDDEIIDAESEEFPGER